MKQNTKDWIQYMSAIALIAAAIIAGLTSVLQYNNVMTGTNTFIGISLSGALTIFGITTFVVDRIGQFKTEIRNELKDIKREEERRKTE